MQLKSNGPDGLRKPELRVNGQDRPAWVSGNGQLPRVGDPVYCTAGDGIVVSLHGKTSDGSRLLQIRLSDEKAPPFFAASSNVLVAPRPAPSILTDASETASIEPCERGPDR